MTGLPIAAKVRNGPRFAEIDAPVEHVAGATELPPLKARPKRRGAPRGGARADRRRAADHRDRFREYRSARPPGGVGDRARSDPGAQGSRRSHRPGPPSRSWPSGGSAMSSAKTMRSRAGSPPTSSSRIVTTPTYGSR